ncbi:YjcZ family sporulation protein [Bacillus cereus group sp. N31]|nr:YjcZ family sporulation protein [Bacillus cereus group sp. N31]QWH92484.1 YjcZ family sporulation protein [Bacillus toyonensis]QWI35670.1 YjcZ family sporulation protein [Bacillus toyonensis]HDR7893164.1 YjcZ family sporulation protein [Bacillus toyonensis]
MRYNQNFLLHPPVLVVLFILLIIVGASCFC